MITAFAYQYIYLLVVSIMTLAVVKKYRIANGGYTNGSGSNDAGTLLLAVILALFIGFRPLSVVFVDMMNYNEHYHTLWEGRTFFFDYNTENLLFDNLFAWWGAESLGLTSFFVLMAFIYFGASYIGIHRIFSGHTFAAYLVFLAAFSTFSYATNGIKAGAAASLFIMAMGYREKLYICIPLVLVSLGFHHSMQLPVAAFVLTLLFKNPKWYYYGWVFCLLMALAHVSFFQNLFVSYTDESGADYLNGGGTGSDGLKGGFRIDFIIYSAIPVIFGYLMEMKRKRKVSKFYASLIHLYLCINGVWMLCMYAEFTNRIAYLSWFLYPIVLVYPFLKENWGANKYRMFAKVMGWHLAFTVFMEMIYYGGLMRLFS